ncbi:MAG: AtpZ/AtpI family protein [Endomicrobiales bacterium]
MQPDSNRKRPERKKTDNILKIARWGALALSIPFEMAAGPYIGYLIGSSLMRHFGIHKAVVVVFIVMGLVGSFINTTIIIEMIINRENQSSMK